VKGQLTIASTGKSSGSGRWKRKNTREGPVMIFLTTRQSSIDEELMKPLMS